MKQQNYTVWGKAVLDICIRQYSDGCTDALTGAERQLTSLTLRREGNTISFEVPEDMEIRSGTVQWQSAFVEKGAGMLEHSKALVLRVHHYETDTEDDYMKVIYPQHLAVGAVEEQFRKIMQQTAHVFDSSGCRFTWLDEMISEMDALEGFACGRMNVSAPEDIRIVI